MELKGISLFDNAVARGSVIFVVNSVLKTDQVRVEASTSRLRITLRERCAQTTMRAAVFAFMQCFAVVITRSTIRVAGAVGNNSEGGSHSIEEGTQHRCNVLCFTFDMVDGRRGNLSLRCRLTRGRTTGLVENE